LAKPKLTGVLSVLKQKHLTPAVIFIGAITFGSEVKAQRGPAVVEVVPIQKRTDIAPSQPTVGTVTPSRTAVIGSAVDGRVTELFVREGDRVEEDQALAQLLTATIELELEAAKEELELRQQELAELENGSRAEELAQTSARLEATRIAAEYREKDRERVEALWKNNAISASEYEDAVSLALEARQRFAEAQAAHELALAGPRKERIAQARAQVAIRDAVVRRLEDQIKKHTLYSRFPGYVTVEHTEVGQWLARGEPVAEIIALDEVKIEVKVLEMHIPYIHAGDSVAVKIPALPGEKFQGTVKAVIPQADVRSRTFPVKILVKNRISDSGEPLLKSGMLARAELMIGDPSSPLLVPKDALVLRGDSTMIWTVDPQSIESGPGDMLLADAVPVTVSMGMSDGEQIEVQGDLEPGTLVVIRGNERILPSQPGQAPPKITWKKT
jgi:HlyD family secretion protein